MIFRRIYKELTLAFIIVFLAVSIWYVSGWENPFRADTEVSVVSPLAHQLGYSKDRPLVMGMNTSYAPLQYVDAKGIPCGYDVEFTKLLMKRMGIPFTFAPNHWDKMSPGIIGGKYDMGLLVYSPYRKNVTNYSNAVFRQYYQIVYRKKDFSDFDFRHLKGRKIAYMKSRPIGLMLKEEGARDVSITDLRQAFIDLSQGKYDGLICYRFQARYHMEELGLVRQLQADELSLEPREYCYASYSKPLIDAINDELKRMEAEGVIDEVYGQDVLSSFGVKTVPVWVWYLLALLTFVFLVIFSVNRYLLSKRLELAHKRLQAAYDQMSEKNKELRIANAKAEESTRMKNVFIKQISHEIRTPLNILSGFSQIITSPDGKLSEKERQEASAQIVDNTARITGLINKMLELSDVSSQTVIERADEVSAQYIASLAVITSGIENASHVSFNQTMGPGTEKSFKTSLSSAVRILELLLDNAMKFTRPAEAYLSQQVVTQQANVELKVSMDENQVCFVVEDTGIGIPAKDAERVFTEFVQLDEYYDGTGIGLAVARSLARRLGGDVVLDTTYIIGARFVVTLPV